MVICDLINEINLIPLTDWSHYPWSNKAAPTVIVLIFYKFLKQLGFTVLSKHIGKKMAMEALKGNPLLGVIYKKVLKYVFSHFFIFSLTSKQKEWKNESKKEKNKRQQTTDRQERKTENRKKCLNMFFFISLPTSHIFWICLNILSTDLCLGPKNCFTQTISTKDRKTDR